MGCRRYHLSPEVEWVGQDPADNQAGDMGNINHKNGSGRLGDFGEGGVVEFTGIGAESSQNQLRLVFFGQVGQLVVINRPGLDVCHPVADKLVLTGYGCDWMAVTQVTAMTQVHCQDLVASFEPGMIGGLVGLGPGMGLDVGVISPEQLLGPVDRQSFNLVGVGLAAIIAPAGVALGVFVSKDGP